jgi:hypothetical protein
VWCCWYDGYENSIGQAMPPNTHEKIKIQKMAKLIKRGLVSGCGCGCRGDYEITKKGIEWLSVSCSYIDKLGYDALKQRDLMLVRV